MRPCEYCGNNFKPAKAIRRFCSRRCSNLGAPRHQPRQLDGSFYDRNGERIKAERRARYAGDPEYRKRVLARIAAAKQHPIRRPCESCGADRADRHHEDYDKPLDIIWLCRRCHIKRHVEISGSWGSGLPFVPLPGEGP